MTISHQTEDGMMLDWLEKQDAETWAEVRFQLEYLKQYPSGVSSAGMLRDAIIRVACGIFVDRHDGKQAQEEEATG